MRYFASSMLPPPLVRVLLMFAICSTSALASTGNGTHAPQDETNSNSSAPTPTRPETQLVHPEIPRIAPNEVKLLLNRKADIVIVDTQPADGYDLWHIPTAVNIPYTSTEDPTDLELRLSALPTNKLIVIYCLCEEGADSAMIALKLRHLGYGRDKVRVLGGGLIRWDELGYPLVKQPNP